MVRARARKAEETVNGPEDSVVADMIKQLTPQEKTFEITKCFQAQAHFMCQEDGPGSWRIVKFVYLGKPNAEPETKKKDDKLQGDRISRWWFRSGTRRASVCVETAVNGRLDGIGCQHLQGMSPLLLQRHRKWLEDRMNAQDVWQGSDKRHTIHIASMEIKAAFDVARPKQIANILGGQDVYGWITRALQREMEKQATVENVESKFQVRIRQGNVEAPAKHTAWNVERSWKEKRTDLHPDENGGGS